MSHGKSPYTRSHYFIKKDFQTKFILKFCLLLLAGVIVSTGLLFIFSRDTLTSSFQDSKLVIENTAMAILPNVLYAGLITLALLAIATIIVTLFISHRIAGPMFRFEKELKEIGKGDLTKKVSLRKKDQAQELADCINDMTASLRGKVIPIRTGLEHILKSARKQNASNDLIEELEKLHQDILSNLKT
ncbi:MAG: methyl-accepting chemotaxis protein [Deltaproteobacteria bacterium]|nr:methyl-accepting chemotaxis protein [Deltaproteobacteria bacterium]MBW2220419.1 methyl-accepting chemotaxis protein [Deltaproteobacteria bacterium]